MKTPFLALLFLTWCIPSFLLAQSDASEKTTAFGLHVSNISGTGLSMRNHISGKTSFQFTGGIISINGETKWSIGSDLLYRIARMPDMDITIGPATGIGGGSSKESGVSFGFGIGADYRSPSDVTSNYMIATARLYYPAVYSGSGDVSIGGGLSFMVAF
ncbi:MAG: hypothetical protein A2X67_14900 [Ignavibacteria bacterium GWA2_55_11]|nr:MAG: hypothetical protein A2X67_14900 [Ignavibacteria bacterium GWA2_55_11]OGU75322.1 MAG: hypothetical protein A3H45_02865 [Ignavibacteria bacterium RIFCSPLOWO2_02_FULL_55_14]OGU76058.1 MAG: hypothetical protein A3G43_10185 [Ignavibacteria bacterium RIFCSPLOWO2_12_FULL_56_21]